MVGFLNKICYYFWGGKGKGFLWRILELIFSWNLSCIYYWDLDMFDELCKYNILKLVFWYIINLVREN